VLCCVQSPSCVVIDFDGSLLDNGNWLDLCIVDTTCLHRIIDRAGYRLGDRLADKLLVLVLEQHVVDRRQADASSQDVVDAGSLAEQSVDEWSAARNQRSLAQETQDRQHRVEPVHNNHTLFGPKIICCFRKHGQK